MMKDTKTDSSLVPTYYHLYREKVVINNANYLMISGLFNVMA